MKHVADMVGGPGFKYLGHFAKKANLVRGHNDVDDNSIAASQATYNSNLQKLSGDNLGTGGIMKANPVGAARALHKLNRSLKDAGMGPQFGVPD